MTSSPRIGFLPVLFSLFGWPALAMGLLFLAISFVCPLNELWPIVIMAYVFLLLGVLSIKLATRRIYPNAEVCMRADSRAPILYLRPFDDDQAREENWMQLLIAGPDTLIRPTAEEKVARELGRLGPVIAIGRPEEPVPPLGAARMYFSDDTWQAGIRRHIPSSQLIVLRAGTTQGLQWEFGALRELARPEQVIIHLPFKRRLFGKGKDASYQAFKALAEPAFGTAFPERIGKAQFLYFDAEWQVQVAKKVGFGPLLRMPRTLRALLRQVVPRPWPKNTQGKGRHQRLSSLVAHLGTFFYAVTLIGLVSVGFAQHELMIRTRWDAEHMARLMRGDSSAYSETFDNPTLRGAIIRWYEGPREERAELVDTRPQRTGPFYQIYGERRGFSFPMGIMDWSGEEVIAPDYQKVGNFSTGMQENLAPVMLEFMSWAYVNTHGVQKHVIKAKFAGDFHEGLARIDYGDDSWGYIDERFEPVIPAGFNDALDFDQGLALVQRPDALFLGWHFINPAGEVVIEGDFGGSYRFSEGIVAVVNSDFEISYYNQDGTQPFTKSFAAGCSFREGLALVSEGGPWGLIGLDGEYVIEPSLFYNHESFFELGMDTDSRDRWSADIGFSSGLLPAMQDGKWGYIDRSGSFVIQPTYLFAQVFSDGVAWVQNAEEQWGLIDTEEQILIPHKYDSAYPFVEGRGRVYPPDGIVDKADQKIH